MRSFAFCPLSVSLVFKACLNNKDVNHSGSVGAGFTINRGVTVEAKSAKKTQVTLNGEVMTFPTVLTVVRLLTDKQLAISISSPLPISCGFGVSGASALATAYSINNLLRLGKTDLELAGLAHRAEIENKTGLGTVATQYTGGFLIKEKPGIPVSAIRLPFTGKKVYATILGRLDTPKMLSDKNILKKADRSADRAIDHIKKLGDLGSILDESLNYVRCLGIIDPKISGIISVIKECGRHASMAIFGKVIISDVEPTGLPYRIEELIISDSAVMIKR